MKPVEAALKQHPCPELILIRSRALNMLGDFTALKTHTLHYNQRYSFQDLPALYIDQAFWRIEEGDHAQAKLELERVLPLLQGEQRGRALHRLGCCLNAMQLPSWPATFQEARSLLVGRLQGVVLIDEAGAYMRAGNQHHQRAISLLSTALGHFANEPQMCMVIHHNLALLLSRTADPQAEQYFIKVQQQARLPHNKDMLSLSHLGLSVFRRRQGEWERAQYSAELAIREAQHPSDRIAGTLALCAAHRMAGQVIDALTVLNQLPEEQKKRADVKLAFCTCLLMLDQPDQVAEVFPDDSAIQGLFPGQREHALLLKAELCRRKHEVKEAVFHLSQIPLHHLHHWEEGRCFPELFRLARQHHLNAPSWSPPQEQLVVDVKTLGHLEVRVNHRSIELGRGNRTGELLVLLLLHRKEATLEKLALELYAQQERTNTYDGIWKLVKNLRERLGWKQSVVLHDGICALDRRVRWNVDLEALNPQSWNGNFLLGMQTPWIQEYRRKLECLDPLPRESLFLSDVQSLI